MQATYMCSHVPTSSHMPCALSHLEAGLYYTAPARPECAPFSTRSHRDGKRYMLNTCMPRCCDANGLHTLQTNGKRRLRCMVEQRQVEFTDPSCTSSLICATTNLCNLLRTSTGKYRQALITKLGMICQRSQATCWPCRTAAAGQGCRHPVTRG